MELTREQIETMPAGRELDALIAEHVCKLGSARWENNEPMLYSQWGRAYTRQYSTDIAAAWDVLMDLKDRRPNITRNGFSLTEALIEQPKGEWKTVFKCQIGGHSANRGYAETTPLAICRAALLATHAQQ